MGIGWKQKLRKPGNRGRFDLGRKRAISAVLGAILMVGVTLSVGFAAWAWARSAAVSSECNFGISISSNTNYLKENYVIVNVNFSSSATQNVTVWLYNSGNNTVYIKQMWISNVTSTSQWSNSTSRLTPTAGSTIGMISYSSPKVQIQTASCGGSSATTSCYCLTLPAGQVTPVELKANHSFVSGIIYQFKALGAYGTTYTYQQAR
jgi:hypothetical protein